MDKRRIQFDSIDKRLRELKKVFFNSDNLQETLESHEHLLEDLNSDIRRFDYKNGFDESESLISQLEEIKNYVKNHSSNEDENTLNTLGYIFGDDLENGDFPDNFDMDDYFGLYQ